MSSPSSSRSSIGRQPSGFGAGISRFAVGTLSLWLRAHEAGANAVDTAVSCLDIGGLLVGWMPSLLLLLADCTQQTAYSSTVHITAAWRCQPGVRAARQQSARVDV